MMRNVICSFLFCMVLFLAPGVGFCADDTTVTLKPSLKQNEKVYPYRNAVLTVNNYTGENIGAVELQDSRGGPRMVFPTVIVPDTSARVDVYLPAVSIVQNYNIKLLSRGDSNDSSIAVLKSQISWPPNLLTRDAFFDSQVYETYEESTLLWENDIKSKAFVLLGIAAVGMSGVLLICRTWLRIGLLVALVVAACVIDFTMRTQPFEIVTDPQGLIILSSRETFNVDVEKNTIQKAYDSSQQKISEAVQHSAPIYPARWAYREENMTIHSTKGLSFTLHPGRVRVFRKCKSPLSGIFR